ncbi:MAG: hypothetical protein JRN68_06995 [Nitrososphaerota archaeon]|nr:hypothetical protein [Nitrososphaerota archaeon]
MTSSIPDKSWMSITDDPPFNMHVIHDIENASFVVGKAANYYVQEFTKLYGRTGEECIVTAITGRPGSGKSFMLAHLKYLMVKKRTLLGIPIIIRLIGKRYSDISIIKEIRSSAEWRDITCPTGEVVNDARLPSFFRKELSEIRKRNQNTVLCLFVDNIDEYVRINGDILLKEDKNKVMLQAWKEAMLDLIRSINSINNMVGSGICTVLSLTTDLTRAFGLEDMRGHSQEHPNILMQDGSLRRRFFPITQSPESSRLYTIDKMEQAEAEEMVSKNLKMWFDRHPGHVQKTPEQCDANGFNLYPFTREAIDLICQVSVTPGEIMAGCLYTFNRYHELRKEISQKPGYQDYMTPLITESIAASSILQLSEYFKRALAEDSKNFPETRLTDIVSHDELFQSTYILSQAIDILKLSNPKIITNLGYSFVRFLNILTNNKIQHEPISDRPTFVMTRGNVRFPKFPVFDCMFRFEKKLVGVMFLTASNQQEVETKLETACFSLKAVHFEDAEMREGIDHVHFVLMVIIDQSEAISQLLHAVHSEIHDLGKTRFVSSQNRDYRPRIAVVRVSNDTAWSWKVLQMPNTVFNDDAKRMLSFSMENTEVIFGDDTPDSSSAHILTSMKSMKWQHLLAKITKSYDIPPERSEVTRRWEESGFDR